MLKNELVKCLNKLGEVRWLAPSIAGNPIRMKQIECTLFPEIEKPPTPEPVAENLVVTKDEGLATGNQEAESVPESSEKPEADTKVKRTYNKKK